MARARVNRWQEPGLTVGPDKEEVLSYRWKTNIILAQAQTTGSGYLRGSGLYLSCRFRAFLSLIGCGYNINQQLAITVADSLTTWGKKHWSQ